MRFYGEDSFVRAVHPAALRVHEEARLVHPNVPEHEPDAARQADLVKEVESQAVVKGNHVVFTVAGFRVQAFILESARTPPLTPA